MPAQYWRKLFVRAAFQLDTKWNFAKRNLLSQWSFLFPDKNNFSTLLIAELPMPHFQAAPSFPFVRFSGHNSFSSSPLFSFFSFPSLLFLPNPSIHSLLSHFSYSFPLILFIRHQLPKVTWNQSIRPMDGHGQLATLRFLRMHWELKGHPHPHLCSTKLAAKAHPSIHIRHTCIAFLIPINTY